MNKPPLTPADWMALHEEIATCTARYNDASQALSDARAAETSALNALNRAQGALIAAVNDLRKSAPPASDMGRNNGFVTPGTE